MDILKLKPKNTQPVVVAIDDDSGNLLALEVALSELPCQVLSFTSGTEAIRYIENHRVAAILLDIRMPGLSGFDVAQKVRTFPQAEQTPIIFVSGASLDEDEIDQMEFVGGFTIIQKPINPKILRPKIKFFIDLFLKTEKLEASLEDEKTLLLDKTLDAIVSINEENIITYWNKNAEGIFGWSKEEALGQDLSLIVPERLKASHRAGLQRFISTGVAHIQNKRLEIPAIRKNGEEFLIELTVSAVKVRTGYRFFSFMRDISEQKRAQETIATSQRTLSQIFNESLSMMVVLKGPDLIFELANAKYLDFLGRQDVVGKSVREVLPELGSQGFVSILEQVYETQNPYVGTEVPLVIQRPGKSNEPLYFNFVYQPLTDAEGKTIGIVGQGQDVTDQVRARKRLEEAERKASEQAELLSLITNAIPDFISYVDSEERYQFANAAYETWFHRDVTEIVGKPVKEVIGSTYHRSEVHIKKALTGQEVRYEAILHSQEGQTRTVDTRYIPDMGPRGEVRGYVAIAHDVTELQKSREIVQNQSRYLEHILNQIQAAAMLIDPQTGNVKFANQAAMQLTGGLQRNISTYTEEYQLYDSQGKIVPRDQFPRARAARGETILGEEYSWHTPNGRWDFLMYADMIPEMLGQPATAFVSFLDITDLKNTERNLRQREEALQRSTQRLQFLAQASVALNSSLDTDQVLTALSDLTVPELADWCSIRMIDEQGQLKQVAVSHKDPEKVKWAWELHKRFPPDPNVTFGPYEVLRTQKPELAPKVSEEALLKTAKTEEQEQLIRSLGFQSYVCVPILSRGRAVGTLSLVSTSESGRSYSEEDLELALELGVRAGVAVENARLYLEAQSVNRLKDEFLANLSHELRTPMNVILGYSEILQTESSTLSDAEFKSFLEAIYRNAKAQGHIITDLLDVSAIITGKVTFEPQTIDPREVIEKAVLGLKTTADAKGVQMITSLSSAPTTASADPTRLQQIIWNLISNAIKFTPSGGTVTVTASATSTDWCLCVKDSGIGIDKDFLPYVFERFRQEDASSTRRFGGLGLGLSVVKNLVEIHGGSVQADSQGRGHGAEFKVVLPLVAKIEN